VFKLIQVNNPEGLKLHLHSSRFKIDITKIYDRSGYTPLHYAGYKDNLSCMKELLDFVQIDFSKEKITGDSGSCQGEGEKIPLMSERKKQDYIHEWINRNADGDDAFTPLHFASFHGNIEMVKLLVRNHGDVFKTNS
jgi:ankyrin repeat protein